MPTGILTLHLTHVRKPQPSIEAYGRTWRKRQQHGRIPAKGLYGLFVGQSSWIRRLSTGLATPAKFPLRFHTVSTRLWFENRKTLINLCAGFPLPASSPLCTKRPTQPSTILGQCGPCRGVDRAGLSCCLAGQYRRDGGRSSGNKCVGLIVHRQSSAKRANPNPPKNPPFSF